MAIHELVGTFHRDTTRSKTHSATLLIEVKSEHSGQFVLSRNGTEAMDLHQNQSSSINSVAAAAGDDTAPDYLRKR
jgi:hypothetical protein